jgi:hypothetical protein
MGIFILLLRQLDGLVLIRVHVGLIATLLSHLSEDLLGLSCLGLLGLALVFCGINFKGHTEAQAASLLNFRDIGLASGAEEQRKIAEKV